MSLQTRYLGLSLTLILGLGISSNVLALKKIQLTNQNPSDVIITAVKTNADCSKGSTTEQNVVIRPNGTAVIAHIGATSQSWNKACELTFTIQLKNSANFWTRVTTYVNDQANFNKGRVLQQGKKAHIDIAHAKLSVYFSHYARCSREKNWRPGSSSLGNSGATANTYVCDRTFSKTLTCASNKNALGIGENIVGSAPFSSYPCDNASPDAQQCAACFIRSYLGEYA